MNTPRTAPRIAGHATKPDPAIWRWCAELKNHRRLRSDYDGAYWTVAVDGKRLARDCSFESALKAAYTVSRALHALTQNR